MSRDSRVSGGNVGQRAGARVVLQARMGSSRLPGKALAPITGRSILAHCIERLSAASVGEIVVATTTRSEDEAIVAEAERLRVRVVRGSVEDVLSRFVLAVEDWDGPYVVRACANNPLVDIDAAGRVLSALVEGAEYCVEDGLPVGSAVEAFRTETIRDASRLAVAAYDRAHVTPYLRHQPSRYAVKVLRAPAALYRPHLRLTVDTRADLQYLRSVMDQVGAQDRIVSLNEIIALSDRYADWAGVA